MYVHLVVEIAKLGKNYLGTCAYWHTMIRPQPGKEAGASSLSLTNCRRRRCTTDSLCSFVHSVRPCGGNCRDSSAEKKLTSLPELETAVSRLRFVPVTERSSEQPHGILKTNITYRRHGPLSVAMSARAPEFERDFVPSETQFKSFVQHAEAAMSVRRIPHLLQLGGHPWLKPLSAGKFDSSRWVTILSHAIYSCGDI